MWSEYRKKRLVCYEKAKEEGKVDEDIIPLLERINGKESYVTLSSCSGRIAVIDLESFGDKKSSRFLGKWHNLAIFEDVLECIRSCKRQGWLIQDPPIIHVACRDLDSAKNLLTVANNSGFRRSGIISLKNYVVEMASFERLELPVVFEGKKIVDDDYLRIAVDIANEKLKKGKIKLKRLEEMLTSL